MFVVTFVVMLPILATTKDPVQAWEAGLTWVFVQSFVLMAGGFIAPVIRKITPRAALLGSLAGISITFISMRPGAQMFMTPLHRHRLLRGHPGQLVRRRALFPRRAGRPGRDRGRHAHRLGLQSRSASDYGGLSLAALGSRLRQFRLLAADARRSAMSSPASNSSASSWSPPSPSASMTSSRRWTMSRAPRRPAIPSRRRGC